MQEIHEQLYKFFKNYRQEVDSKLLFTYRKSNIGGYLDKGYYFLGDDNVAMVSFWSGINFNTRKPYISISIYKDGQIFLEVSLDNSEMERIFISRHILPLYPFQDNRSNTGTFQYLIGYVTELESVINNFINHDKKIIDEIINTSSLLNYNGRTRTKEMICFLDRKNQEIDEIKIEQYRNIFIRSEEYEKSQNINEKPIHIQFFQVRNFAIIENAEFSNLPNENRWVFLTGENGSGKTLILKALAIALAQGVLPSKYLKLNHEKPSFSMVLKRSRGDTKEYNRDGDNDGAKYAKTPCVMGFAAYGIFRHEVRIRRENDPLSKQGSLDSILSDDKVVSLLDFNQILHEWGKNKRVYDQFEKRKYFLQNTLIEIVPGLVDIHFVKGRQRIKAEYFIENESYGAMKLDYSQLSSGTRSILSLVGDIFIRFYNQQPKIDDPSEFRGIVIIDEIDLHLHPIGQRDLVINLSRVFPNIQFIVSTHSPIPLLGAPSQSVFIKVQKDAFGIIEMKRLIHIEKYIGELLPNHLLTSDLFGLESITSITNKEKINVFTGQTMNDYIEFKALKAKNDLRDPDNNAFLEKLKARLNEKNK